MIHRQIWGKKYPGGGQKRARYVDTEGRQQRPQDLDEKKVAAVNIETE